MVALLALAFVGLAMVGSVAGLFAWMRTSRLERRIDELARELAHVRRSRGAARRSRRAFARRRPAAAAPWCLRRPGMCPCRTSLRRPRSRPQRTSCCHAPRPRSRRHRRRRRRRRRPTSRPTSARRSWWPPARSPSWSSSGLFVKYAWDNNWVGPAGRVLIGAVIGLGLLALGIRLMRREYRPLGQGLAAAGLAGTVHLGLRRARLLRPDPREASALLMIAVTASAVLLAVRLDARLLAALAWIGGYMTPLLLSTGEDRARGAVPVPGPARRRRPAHRPPQAVAGDGAHRDDGHGAPVLGLVRAVLPPRAVRGRRPRASCCSPRCSPSAWRARSARAGWAR